MNKLEFFLNDEWLELKHIDRGIRTNNAHTQSYRNGRHMVNSISGNVPNIRRNQIKLEQEKNEDRSARKKIYIYILLLLCYQHTARCIKS